MFERFTDRARRVVVLAQNERKTIAVPKDLPLWSADRLRNVQSVGFALGEEASS